MPPSHLLCKRQGCYHSASKTHVTDRIFKLSPVHASMIYQICWIQWISVLFRENIIITANIWTARLLKIWTSSCWKVSNFIYAFTLANLTTTVHSRWQLSRLIKFPWRVKIFHHNSVTETEIPILETIYYAGWWGWSMPNLGIRSCQKVMFKILLVFVSVFCDC